MCILRGGMVSYVWNFFQSEEKHNALYFFLSPDRTKKSSNLKLIFNGRFLSKPSVFIFIAKSIFIAHRVVYVSKFAIAENGSLDPTRWNEI